MLLAPWAITSPTTASAKLSQFGRSAMAAANSPPIRPEVAAMGKAGSPGEDQPAAANTHSPPRREIGGVDHFLPVGQQGHGSTPSRRDSPRLFLADTSTHISVGMVIGYSVIGRCPFKPGIRPALNNDHRSPITDHRSPITVPPSPPCDYSGGCHTADNPTSGTTIQRRLLPCLSAPWKEPTMFESRLWIGVVSRAGVRGTVLALLLGTLAVYIVPHASFKMAALTSTWRGFLAWQVAGNLAGFITVLTLTGLLRFIPRGIAFTATTGLAVLGVQVAASGAVFHERLTSGQWLPRLGVYEFSADPECILRIRLARAPHELPLPGSLVPAGAPVIELHLWNEHVPPMPAGGPDLAWAREATHRFIRSMGSLAGHMRQDPRLVTARALGGVTPLATPFNSDGGEGRP